ncbi:TetR family transcriptional regulator [Streptomyces syringium]|uniref:TetR family transcriptional regulator n=1 Tax=Streptomyces syringium TaxID=76729 RepID=UPI0037D07A52
MTTEPKSATASVAIASSGLPLTERQEARRRRILHATAQLAGRGGFDAVQMREVAESSSVALGTLYRYFPSKIHLLVATMQDQLQHLHETLRKRPPTEEEPAARVAQTLMRAFRAMQREPHLADAMVRALTFADRSVSAEVDAASRLTTTIILDAMGLTVPPTPAQLSAVRVIEHTWHSALITWLSGRASIAQVKIDIETVCRLIDLTSAAPGPTTGTAGARDTAAGTAAGAAAGGRAKSGRTATSRTKPGRANRR